MNSSPASMDTGGKERSTDLTGFFCRFDRRNSQSLHCDLLKLIAICLKCCCRRVSLFAGSGGMNGIALLKKLHLLKTRVLPKIGSRISNFLSFSCSGIGPGWPIRLGQGVEDIPLCDDDGEGEGRGQMGVFKSERLPSQIASPKTPHTTKAEQLNNHPSLLPLQLLHLQLFHSVRAPFPHPPRQSTIDNRRNSRPRIENRETLQMHD